eukprot:CAMPEP_0183704782 /NCGR_PEP_ID=MMETSP0737-20130205/2061_1 /TAXON_ID=385413 /ORGANISM="Thalassiosira miniscula, Strain CCMP1093" /LENGTH=256 /DNA_ID=CAMNT_0025931785 /DNA_START=88 /DNA_END=854 /DNA_ORIENTATION=-
MPKLQAAVPAGAPPNALLRVRLPDGNEVNVRVPEGLKPGDEFIFEVSTMGEITSSTPTVQGTKSTGNSGGGSKKGVLKQGVLKPGSKNPKKRRSNNANDASNSSSNNHRGGDSSSSHSNNNANNNAPSFISGFFNMYNQVYDILSQNNQQKPTSRQTPPKGDHSKSNNHGNSSLNNNHNISPSPSSNNHPSSTTMQAPKNTRLTSLSSHSHSNSTLGFLDRNFTSSTKDFMTALLVGMFIGTSIVVGFLGGVLWVT